MSKLQQPKIGLALGSGGAKGLAHIGVIKTLEKHNIPIHGIAGSSIGALIGAYYAFHKDSKKLEEIALSFNRRKGFRLFDPSLRGGLIKGKKIEQLIEEMLEGANFTSLQIPFAAVATDFTTAEPVIFTEGNLVKAIRASISVSTIFQPVLYQKRLLADGALSNPVPADILRSLDMDIIIAVNLDTLYVNDVVDTLPSLSKIPMHSIDILRHHLALHTTKTADVIIAPRIPYQIGLIGWSYFFDTKKGKEIIKSGEYAALEVIPKLQLLMREWENQKKPKPYFSRLFSFIGRHTFRKT